MDGGRERRSKGLGYAGYERHELAWVLSYFWLGILFIMFPSQDCVRCAFPACVFQKLLNNSQT